VDVEYVKSGMDSPHEDIGDPVPTPTEKINPFEELFGKNNWWCKLKVLLNIVNFKRADQRSDFEIVSKKE